MAIIPTPDGAYFVAYVTEVLEAQFVISDACDYDAIIDGWGIRVFRTQKSNVTMVRGYDQVEATINDVLGATVVEIAYPEISLMIDPALVNIPFPAPNANKQYLAYNRITCYSEFHLAVIKESLPEALRLLNPLDIVNLPSTITSHSVRLSPQPRLVKMCELKDGVPVRDLVIN